VAKFLYNYLKTDYNGFAEIYAAVLGIDLRLLILGIAGILVLSFVLSITFGAISRHMLTGNFDVSPALIKNRLNYNFATALKVCLSAVVVFEVFSFLEAAFFYMWTLVPNKTVGLVLSVITWAVMIFLQLLVFSVIILWTPNMLHSGFKSAEALTYGIRQINGNVFKTVFALVIPLLPFLVLMIIGTAAEMRLGGLLRVVDSLTYLAVFIYYIALMYGLFFDLTGTERADLKAKKEEKRGFAWDKKRGKKR
jgi:hypothetical protein